MKRNNKITFLVISLFIATLGVGGGTFAWFQVLNTTNAALSGAIIGSADKLQVGFRVSQFLNSSELNDYHLIEDTYSTPGPGYVYWASSTITAETTNFIVAKEGYTSNNYISPITTGSYVAGDALDFYERPVSYNNVGSRVGPIETVADTSSYFRFTLLFRMATVATTSSLGGSVGLEGYNLYFDSNTRFAGPNNVSNALRLGIGSEIGTDIIAPAYTTPGEIAVGGAMDLNGDGFNDYSSEILKEDGSFDPNRYEIAYGEFTAPLTDANWGTPSGIAVAPIEGNVNFYDGVTYKDASPLINCQSETATYNTIAAYTEIGTPLATTDANGIAEIDLSIWLEGWDHACTNAIAGTLFGATINFVAQ